MDKKAVTSYIEENIYVKNLILSERVNVILEIAQVMRKALASSHTIFWCGNGGSAADAQHLAAELVGRFRIKRKALSSIALTTDSSVLTSVSNDLDFSEVFARQVEALVGKGDVVVGISTSGNSTNVIRALKKAKQLGAKTIAFTGETGGNLKKQADLLLAVPSKVTSHIQEAHTMVGHIICHLIEQKYLHFKNV